MSGHLSLDELAELDAGLVARRNAAAAERHLDECEECTARITAIRRTTERLNELGPVAMPDDVAARLNRALRDATATSTDDVVPDLGEVRARRLGGISPWAYAAAAAVVVLGGAGIAIGTLHHHKSHTDAAVALAPPLVATHEPRAAVPLTQQESGRTYTPTTIQNLATRLVTGSSHSDALGTANAPGAVSAPSVGTPGEASGGAAARPQQGFAATKNAASPGPALAPAPAAIPASLQPLAGSRQALLRCAAFISDTPNAAPLAVDFGRWTNAAAHIRRVPAVIFVFADATDSTSVDVFVVGAACDSNSLLDYQVLPKP
ncbi:MAG TPA: hypothetical protein VG650_12055 [Mycobacteriales bacterium]|nr:hypothetical protein [Mycobacteriales bacterium]